MNSEWTLGAITRRLAEAPFQRFLEIEARSVDKELGQVEFMLPFRTGYARAEGDDQVHGGVVAAFVDIAGDYALAVKLGYFVPTIDLRVDFLRPAHGTLTAMARTVRVGRNVGFVDVDILNASRLLVATGRGLYTTRRG